MPMSLPGLLGTLLDKCPKRLAPSKVLWEARVRTLNAVSRRGNLLGVDYNESVRT